MPSEHPSGYPRADDSPGFVAPPLDLRRAIEAATRGSYEDAVHYALSFPIEPTARRVETTIGFEDHLQVVESETTNPELPVHPIGDEPDTATDLPVVEPTVTSPVIAYLDPDATATMLRAPVDAGASRSVDAGASRSVDAGASRSVDAGASRSVDAGASRSVDAGASRSVDSERTIERDPYSSDGEITIQASERQVLTQSLASIGPLDETPDPKGLLPAQGRVLLARARAIRFRLALLDVWPEDWSSAKGSDEALELAVHPTVVVTLADGFPSEPPQLVGSDDIAVVSTIANDVRERLPFATRAMLRDVGAAAFARVTLLGPERALDYVAERFAELPGKERRAALASATRIATPGRRAEMLERVRVALGL